MDMLVLLLPAPPPPIDTGIKDLGLASVRPMSSQAAED